MVFSIVADFRTRDCNTWSLLPACLCSLSTFPTPPRLSCPVAWWLFSFEEKPYTSPMVERTKRLRSCTTTQSTEERPPTRPLQRNKAAKTAEDYVAHDVLTTSGGDMAGEPIAGEVDSYSDYDSNSEDESINGLIVGASERRLSIQKQGENEAMDEAMNADTFNNTTHVSFEDVLQHLVAPPDLFQEREGSVTQGNNERTDDLIVKEALDLQASHLSVHTKNQYKAHLSKYLKFCDNLSPNNAHGESGRASLYDVSEVKALRFFKEVMFKSTTKKYFDTRKSRYVRTPYMFKSTNTKDQIPTLSQTLADIQPDAEGRKVLDVPCGRQTMENALKALYYLQDRQRKRPIRPNLEPKLRKSSLISNVIDKFTNDLVFGILVNHKDLSAECEVRDTYTVAQHVKCLLYTWARPISVLSPWTREHLALAIRHSMLLRNEDLSQMNLSDCFMLPVGNRDRGSQAIVALVCAMHREKPIGGGHTQYGCALRHSDARRCSIGALAYYLFDRFHNKDEPDPNMNSQDFKQIKLLLGTHGSRLGVLSYSASRETTLKTFESQDMECIHLTHSGRHSGTIEAQKLGIRAEDINFGGRWVRGSGRLDIHSVSNIPIRFAFGMAGFREGEPFHLRRNEIPPSVQLQETIFPFIEKAFGEPGSEANQRWRQECLDEMNEKYEDQPDQLKDTLPLDLSTGTDDAPGAHIDLNKKRFFKMLLRLRRVILQDAVDYLHTHSAVKSPLLENSLFQSELFLKFKDDLAAVLDREDAPTAADIPPLVNETIPDQRQQSTDQYHVLNEQLRQQQIQLQQLQDQLHERNRQDDAYRLWMAENMLRVQNMIQDMMAMQMPSHSHPGYGPNLGHGFDPSAYGPYTYGEEVQHHTTIYQLTSRMPWLGPSMAIPPLQPASSDAPIPHVDTTAAPNRPPTWLIPPHARTAQTTPVAPSSAPRQPKQPSGSVAPVEVARLIRSGIEPSRQEEGRSDFDVMKSPHTARQIWDEQKRFTRFREAHELRTRKKPKLVEKKRKALNNRLRIVEEIEFLAKQSQAEDSNLGSDMALERAMKTIDDTGLSCSALHKYCIEAAQKRLVHSK
ncbi:hypothetical protein KVV02_003439 [Mortierella alpina]|uniref:Ndc10 domain-containing protein n=1 Tax=Mortierella alpina TaxID=64518 RepID=A0A9P8CX49_MORAP|nr:hypothetical protein KVV02_003439 [Mortierella alpina]